METVDYKRLFTETLVQLSCEVFPAHGIDSMPDTEFEEIIKEITRTQYFPCIAEFRRQQGMTMLGDIGAVGRPRGMVFFRKNFPKSS